MVGRRGREQRETLDRHIVDTSKQASDFDGVGFGLGFSVVLDAAQNKVMRSEGEFSWGGAASTIFWVDPVNEIVALFLTQLLPSSTYPIRSELNQLVQQALID